jgi:hypothetical protein
LYVLSYKLSEKPETCNIQLTNDLTLAMYLPVTLSSYDTNNVFEHHGYS